MAPRAESAARQGCGRLCADRAGGARGAAHGGGHDDGQGLLGGRGALARRGEARGARAQHEA
eukprot:1881013-Prymnesium_polylepis.1